MLEPYTTSERSSDRGGLKKIFDRNFFIGCGTGVILTILILMTGCFIFVKYAQSLFGDGLESMLRPPPFPGQAEMDYDWRVQGLDGKELNLAETKGKVIFLNFWATWCPPCVAEMPSIQRLYDQMKDEEIVFMCVSQESSSKASQFVKEKGFTFPVYTAVDEPPSVFKTRGIPATFIVSKDGKIVFKHEGGARWDDKTCIDFITELLQANP